MNAQFYVDFFHSNNVDSTLESVSFKLNLFSF